VSELRPPTGLLFILQVTEEHGQTWWNDIDRGKLICPPEISGNLTSRVKELGEGSDESGFRNISVHISK
jgi:hypothetical protein